MGDVTELFLIMLIIATAAFLPLGYFIYKFTKKNGKPFGETEPHGDSPSLINDFAENVIHFVQSRLAKK
ncbi:MAG: hypothetical protein PHH59_12020 [Methylovulum sp.]|uniref:hypothetical protein n=1 Tax=Methylovulum sp. TaxID=1916980 RepID=UPI002634D196|nr:hypothetical protein [Methylovulum sp.]MDD2724734.1 hypothetical protein [Methylovulum sp.]MDD5124745.1 hypothetical protein [Methylovulum sp.]